MISLKKIIDKIVKNKFKKKAFNLRLKKVFGGRYDDDFDDPEYYQGGVQDTDQALINQENIVDYKKKPSQLGLTVDDDASKFLNQVQPVATSDQMTVDIPRDLKEFVDRVIANDIVSGPSALAPAIWKDPSVVNYFKEVLKESIDNFEKAIKGYVEKTVAIDPRNEIKIREALIGVEVTGDSGNDIVELLTNKLRSTIYRGTKSAIEFLNSKKGNYYTNEAIAIYFGPPANKAMDQRVNFFVHNENLMPENIKSELYSWIEANNGVLKKSGEFKEINKRDKYKYLMKAGKDQELYEELRNIISNLNTGDDNLTSIMMFLMGAAKWREQSDESKTQKSFQQGGVDDEGNSLLNNMSDKGYLPPTETPEERHESRNTNSEVVSYFAKTYIDKVLAGVRSLTDNIVGDVMVEIQKERDAASLLPERTKGKKLGQLGKKQKKAEEISFMMDATIPHLKDMFDKNSGKSIITQSGNDMVYQVKDKESKKRPGSIRFPMSEVLNVAETVLKETGIDPLDASVADTDVQKALDEMISTGSVSWIPNFRKMISTNTITDKFRQVGNVKQNIRRYSNVVKTNGMPAAVKYIIDELKLRKQFPHYKHLELFVQSTLLESDESIGKWYRDKNENENEKKNRYDKSAFYTIIKSMFSYLSKYKEGYGDKERPAGQETYGDAVFNTFFNIFPPHDGVIQGSKEGRADVIDIFTGEKTTYTELYNNLRGVESSPLAQLNLSVSPGGKKRAKDKILRDVTLTDQQKSLKIKEKEQTWIEFEEAFQEIEDYKKNRNAILNDKKLDDEQKGLKIRNLEQNWSDLGRYFRDAKTSHDMERNMESLEKRQEVAEGDLETLKHDRKNKKYDNNGKLLDSKAMATKKLIIQTLKKEIEEGKRYVERFNDGFKDSPIHKKLSNSSLFRIVYASYESVKDSVDRLNKIKKTYKSLKFASVGTKTVDNSIIKIKQDFINKYSFLFD
ncbi:MAG: hypothetical protein J7L15_08965 [Clostridiales bacterium]|nr:hypothetical protein [Clostridiales bacterium]